MKKLFLIAALAISAMAGAQVLNVASVQKLSIPEGDVKVAGLAPDGSYLLLTSGSNVGLQKYDFATATTTVLSTAEGAGYNVQISADGNNVIFRESSLGHNKTRQHALKSQVLSSGKTTTLVRPTRSLRQLTIAGNLQMVRPTASIEDQQLMLTIGGITTQLSPCGTNCSYIWPSVSPDGQKVLFYVGGRGAYVCNLDGSGLTFLGHGLRAPKWYNNSVIIGMNDKDNGEVVVSSEIVVVSLTGERQVIAGVNAMYPYACNGKIVCSGLNGETYLITIR